MQQVYFEDFVQSVFYFVNHTGGATDLHENLMRIGIAHGYFGDHYKNELKGLCNGITLAWLAAELTGEDYLIENFLADMMQYPLPEQGAELEPLSLEQREIFAQTQIHMFPLDHGTIFGEFLRQENYEEVAVYTASARLEAAGGLASIHREDDICTEEEWSIYLDGLMNELDKVSVDRDDKRHDIVAFVVANSNHVCGISYNRRTGVWRLFDINNFLVTFKPYMARNLPFDAFNMYKIIFTLILSGNNAGYLPVSIKSFTVQNDPRLQDLRDRLSAFARNNVGNLTEDKLQREVDGRDLVRLALHGNTYLMHGLFTFKNTSSSDNLARAVACNNMEIFRLLLQKENNIESEILYNAVKTNRMHFIDELIDQNRITYDTVITCQGLQFLAIRYGNTKTLNKLAGYGMRFNDILLPDAVEVGNIDAVKFLYARISAFAARSYGQTCANFAAEQGNAELLGIILDHSNIKKLNFLRIIELAIVRNHPQILHLLNGREIPWAASRTSREALQTAVAFGQIKNAEIVDIIREKLLDREQHTATGRCVIS